MMNDVECYSWMLRSVPFRSILCRVFPRERMDWVCHAGGAGIVGANVDGAAGTKRVLPFLTIQRDKVGIKPTWLQTKYHATYCRSPDMP